MPAGRGRQSPAPNPSLNAKTVGLAAPSSADVIGVNTAGHSSAPHGPCEVSGCQGKHPRHDCPKLFAETYPGRTMPGFDEKGARVPASWKGNDITGATLQ
eukprot:485004-Rhodomonas_salina.1